VTVAERGLNERIAPLIDLRNNQASLNGNRKQAAPGKVQPGISRRTVMADPIELFYWPTPNGWKISIALEEMRLPYTLKPIDIGNGAQFAPAFLKISPNNRMPAITDPDGPGGQPISVFESGAILQYLGRKTGQFYPADERTRVEVDEWLMWQMAGLGPMSGQASHFRVYAPTIEPDPAKTEYGQRRYTNEVNRLYGVLNTRLAARAFVAGDYSIADMAIWPWIRGYKVFGQNIDDFPALKRWFDEVGARPAVAKGVALGEELRKPLPEPGSKEAEARRKALFEQTAQSAAAAAADALKD
jgi:glutathione S-transferase